jgi:DNA repair protein RecO
MQADIIEMFYDLRTDYDRLIAAHLIAEVCDKSIWDSVDCDDLLFLTIKSLSRLSKGRIPSLQVTCVFLLRFFEFHGLQPEINHCVVCGISANKMERFYLCSEGLACGNHNLNVQMNLSPAAVAAIRFILQSELDKVFLFTAYDGVLEELKRATRMLWRIHFEGSYIKTLWMD